MRLLIMGPPGAGKGTQAVMIKEEYSLHHISTGDMFREAMAKATPLGLIAQEHINSGRLVPDEATIGLVKEKLLSMDTSKGFLLDGFPRTIPQAIALDQMLQEFNIPLDAVINIDVDNNVLVKRIAGRRVCSKCKAGYHIESMPPKVEGICDVCGGELISRKDDDEATVLYRLKVYESQTKPLLDYYQKQGLVITVNGDGEIPTIFEKIKIVLGGIR